MFRFPGGHLQGLWIRPTVRKIHHSVTRRSWSEAVSKAETLVQDKSGDTTRTTATSTDIRKIATNQLSHLTQNLHRLVESEHPMLSTMSQYYFQPNSGKHFRPLVVLLMSMATSMAPKAHRVNTTLDYYEEIDHTVSTLFQNTYYTTHYQHSPKPCTSFYEHREQPSRNSPPLPLDRSSPAYDQVYATTTSPNTECQILPSQRRLSEIVELMHTATLLHDDVIDDAQMRRNQPCAHLHFGNKMAILVGDFLIARACCALTRLRHNEVTELLATVISDLTEGEVMQLKNTDKEAIVNREQLATGQAFFFNTTSTTTPSTTPESTPSSSLPAPPDADTFAYYLQKSYLKTASFIAKSCRAAALLGGCTPVVADHAFLYGKHLGLAFQLVDDLLDFTVSQSQLGKPVGADLQLGLATAPVLYAWQEFPELGRLVQRKFSQAGDTQQAWDLVHRSQGLSKTFDLARGHCDSAVQALMELPDSPAREALVDLTNNVLNRKK
ncbi:coq1 putative hexaprenyl diphosphate synthase [Dispira parvispora]|uniref:Coq1 putative hexaprenyl diphosphate synthase n=1 Tax=Dispira parvispora TaxID=1520584 RepID=A0A9W8E9I4_9FUNG|nr:coq1 putative hexaprenyl diphosphate synthase [Dispira parvispora]